MCNGSTVDFARGQRKSGGERAAVQTLRESGDTRSRASVWTAVASAPLFGGLEVMGWAARIASLADAGKADRRSALPGWGERVAFVGVAATRRLVDRAEVGAARPHRLSSNGLDVFDFQTLAFLLQLLLLRDVFFKLNFVSPSRVEAKCMGK